MNILGPSGKNIKYSYNLVSYYGLFGVKSLQIEESDFNPLRREIDKLLKNEDDNSATIYAGKLALEYGVAGLLEYIDICTKLTHKDSAKGEMVNQEVMQLLGLNYFCKKMLLEQKEQKAIDSMELIESVVDYQSSSYWDNNESKLLELIETNQDYVKTEANDIADSLVAECIPKTSMSNY